MAKFLLPILTLLLLALLVPGDDIHSSHDHFKIQHTTTYRCPPCGCAHDETDFHEKGYCPFCNMPLVAVNEGTSGSIDNFVSPLFEDGLLGAFYPKLIYPLFVGGILFAVFLMISIKHGKSINIYLTSIILVIALYGFKNQLYGVQNGITNRHDALFIPISFILLIGPLIYLFTKSSVLQNFKWERKRTIWHFIPAIVVFCMYSILLIAPKAISDGFMSSPFEVSFSHIEQLFAIIIGFWYLNRSYTVVENAEKLDPWLLSWMKRFLIGMATFLGLWGLQMILNYWLYDMEVATLTYNLLWISIAAIIVWISIEVALRPQYFIFNKLHPTTPRNWTDKEIATYKMRLENVMMEQKLYTDPNLNLEKLATQLDTNSKYLSSILNNAIGKSFYEYVTQYRIEEVKQLLKSPKSRNYTIEAMANQAGFKSKSSFNTAFKKHTQMTPKEYIKAEQ